MRLSSTHQNSSLDKKIYDMILNLSTPTLFSPDIYEFMFNYNKFETPSNYVSSINANLFTGIYDNLYKSKNDNQSFQNDLLSIIKEIICLLTVIIVDIHLKVIFGNVLHAIVGKQSNLLQSVIE